MPSTQATIGIELSSSGDGGGTGAMDEIGRGETMKDVSNELDPRPGESLCSIGDVKVPSRLLDGPGQRIDAVLKRMSVRLADVAAMLFDLPRNGWRAVYARTRSPDDFQLVLAAPVPGSVGGWSLLCLNGESGRFDLATDPGPIPVVEF